MEWFLITCLVLFVMMFIAGAINERLMPFVFWGVVLISLGFAFPLFGLCLLGLLAIILFIATLALIGYVLKTIGSFFSKAIEKLR